MRRLVVSAVSAFVLCLSLGTSQARPATTLLDGLRAGLADRATALQTETDPVKLAQLAVLKSAIKAIDKDKSKNVLDDLGTLKKVAGRIELAFGVNDPSLVAAFDGFFSTFTGTVDGVAAQLQTGLFTASAQAQLQGIVSTARTSLAAIASPAPAQNTIKDRSAALQAVGKTALAAASKARKAAKALCAHGGTVRAQVDDGVSASRRYAPPFVDAVWTYSGSTAGPLRSVSITSFYYDRKAPQTGGFEPYHKGFLNIDFTNGVFTGPGTYVITSSGGVANPVSMTYYYEGTFFDGVSGTLTVTSYDAATKDIQGSFTGMFATGGGASTVSITGGGFRVCTWRDLVLSTK